jgi:hypothetical protein
MVASKPRGSRYSDRVAEAHALHDSSYVISSSVKVSSLEKNISDILSCKPSTVAHNSERSQIVVKQNTDHNHYIREGA